MRWEDSGREHHQRQREKTPGELKTCKPSKRDTNINPDHQTRDVTERQRQNETQGRHTGTVFCKNSKTDRDTSKTEAQADPRETEALTETDAGDGKTRAVQADRAQRHESRGDDRGPADA